MGYALAFMFGVIAGGTSVFGLLAAKRSFLNAEERRQNLRNTEIQEGLMKVAHMQSDLDEQKTSFETRSKEFAARVISYEELQSENSVLKHDLQNIDVNSVNANPHWRGRRDDRSLS